jgi:uncharacterized membrane protein (UPF0127 family)
MLVNARTSDVVARVVELAETRAARRRGLLGRDSLDPASALVLVRCFAIHTIGMRFPIDAIFVDRAGIVVRIARDLGPWRIAASWSAHAVIELAGGSPGARDVRIGDRLYVSPEPAAPGKPLSWPISA